MTIPHTEFKTLADCAQFLSGGTPSKGNPDFWEGGIPWVSCKDMKVPRLYDADDHLSEEGAKNGTRLVPPQTILIVVRGMILAKEFPVAMAMREVAFNQDLKALRCNDGVDSWFLYYWLRANSYEILGLVDEAAHGTKRLQSDRLLGLEVKLPHLKTQRKIASILSAYDDLIENNTRRIKILEEMARMIYREWFVNFRFPGHDQVKMVDSPLGMIPEGWEVKLLGDVYSTGSGGTPSRTHEEYYGGEIPWIKTRELNDGFILAADEMITELGLKKSSARVFPTNTVVIAMYGATIGKLGILTHEAATNQACCAFLPQNNTFGYAYLYFTLLNRRADLIALGQGAAQQNISQAVIKGFELLVPDGSVVTTFNRAVEPMLGQIKIISLKNQNLRQTRDLLLPKLISGEVAV